MSSLLEKNQYENGEQTVSVVNGELVIQKIRKQKINNVEVWTDAFINIIGVSFALSTKIAVMNY
jgi:hypothetical protein